MGVNFSETNPYQGKVVHGDGKVDYENFLELLPIRYEMFYKSLHTRLVTLEEQERINREGRANSNRKTNLPFFSLLNRAKATTGLCHTYVMNSLEVGKNEEKDLAVIYFRYRINPITIKYVIENKQFSTFVIQVSLR